MASVPRPEAGLLSYSAKRSKLGDSVRGLPDCPMWIVQMWTVIMWTVQMWTVIMWTVQMWTVIIWTYTAIEA